MKRWALLLVVIALFSATISLASDEPAIGNSPPSLKLNDLAGETLDLKAQLGKGPVVLTFFTSWCQSCVEEFDFLKTLDAGLKKSGLQVVGVSFDRNKEDLKSFLDEKNISFTTLLDKKLSSLDDFRILIIPTTFVIDPSGKIKSIYVEFDENVQKAIEKDVKGMLP